MGSVEEQMVRQYDHANPAASVQGLPVATPMVDRAFQVLELLATREEGYSLSELARKLGASKGSMHGLLKTMQQRGVVEVDGNRRYLLGPYIYDLAQAYIHRGGLRGLALPAMRRLVERSGETVLLGQIESDVVRIVELAEAPADQFALHVAAYRGTRIHLLAGAIGRVVLATWPTARRVEYLQTHALPHFTERSITTTEAFLAAVEEAEHTGIGEEHEEYLTGVNAVAVGIHGINGEVIALLWIAGFSNRFAGDILRDSGEALRAEAQAISQALGGRISIG